MLPAHFWSFQGVTEGRASCSVPVIRKRAASLCYRARSPSLGMEFSATGAALECLERGEDYGVNESKALGPCSFRFGRALTDCGRAVAADRARRAGWPPTGRQTKCRLRRW